MRLPSVVLVLAGVTGLAVASAFACSVPVFRYVLERFQPETYRAVIFHRGPLAPEHKKAVDALRALAEGEGATANLEVELVDLAALTNAAQKVGWEPPAGAALPWLAVAYPDAPLTMPAFSGPLSAESVRLLCDSPARREISKRVLAGDSAVFVLLESGRKAADDAAAKLLQATLGDMQKTLKLPGDDPDAPVQVMADPPLKIAFSILRLSRTDPAEKLFVRILLSGDKDLGQVEGPLVFPVFGRGRALAGIGGKELTAETLQSAGEFLCGACTCAYKEQMPGLDLLIASDWTAGMAGQVVKDAPPPLQGLGTLAQAAAGAQSAPSQAPAVPAANVPAYGLLSVVLLAVLGGIAVAVVLAALVMRAKAPERRE